MESFVIFLFILAVIYLATRESNEGRRAQITNTPTVATADQSRELRVPVVHEGQDAAASVLPVHAARQGSRARSDASASERAWISPGKAITIAGRSIPGGMIYVGESLRAVNDWDSEPALINPNYKVAGHRSPDGAPELSYWPSYSAIHAGNRARYLQWLAEGRSDPHIGIGYVFLFFYGLERRALFDARHVAAARAEVPQIVAEIERLLEVYGQHKSFVGYAERLLGYIRCRNGFIDVANVVPPRTRSSWGLPMEVKLVIGKYVQDGTPIPPEWALAWLRLDPRAGLRTAGERCPEELVDLFMLRYRERFGDGLLLKRNKTNLRVEYHAASSSFHGVQMDHTIDLPDVTRLEGPLTKLRKLGDDVQQELDRYSRWVGRTGDRTSPSAIALLPAPIAERRLTGDAAALLSTVRTALGSGDVAVVSTKDILQYWPVKDSPKVTKAEAAGLGDLLSSLGYGIEPDVRYGGLNPGKTEKLAVFTVGHDAPKPTQEFENARVLLHLGAAVAAADELVTAQEQTSLEEHLQTALRLSAQERTRLQGYLHWLLKEPPSLAGLKPKLQLLTEVQRTTIARFLLAIAGADGRMAAPELKVLGKIYAVLGLDSGSLYDDVHNLAVTPVEPGPVTVIASDRSTTNGYTIPPKSKPSATAGTTIPLDLRRVREIMDNTAAVSTILTSIFAEATEEYIEPAVIYDVDAPEDPIVRPAKIAGLDEAHFNFVKALSTKDQWNQEELSQLATRYGLMSAGAIEMVNQAAFAACDEPLLEGNDPAEVNRYALEEILA